MSKSALVLLAVGLSIITVLADALIKKATQLKQGTLILALVILGGIIYGFTALGWYKVLQKIELLNTGVIYSVSCIILIALVSVFYFKERLLWIEIVGLILAVASILIMYRFN